MVVVKAQVKAGGRGKAGGVKLAKTPDEAQQHADGDPGHGDQGPDRAAGAGGACGVHRRGVLLLVPAGPGRPAVPLHRERRGWCGDRGGRQDQPRGGPQDRDRPRHRRERGEGAGDRRRGEVPRRADRAGRADGPQAVAGLRRGGRHAGRGQPAGPARGRRPRGAGRQGLPRRQRRLPAPGPRGVRGQVRDRPARGQGQGEGPQLRQARRRRGHHRQRRRTGACRRSTWSPTPARHMAG